MLVLKKILPSFYVWLICMAAQMLIIWWLYPSPDDLVPIKTFMGTYKYDGGNARSRAHTVVEGTGLERHALYCAISFVGPIDSCGYQYLNNRFVTVQISHYRHLFGTGEVLAQLTAGDAQYSRSGEQLVSDWYSGSISAAILLSSIAAVLAYGIRPTWFFKTEKKNDD